VANPIFELDHNPEQRDFIVGPESFSGFFGGVGSGKSFANLLRLLLHLTQPIPDGIYEKPRGLMAMESYPVLDDVIMPAWERIQNEIKHKAPNSAMAEKQYIRHKKRSQLNNGARLDFRSTENPDKLRGRELTVYGIDEARNVPKRAWERLFDRLRQPGFKRAGFVTSTPNGYDWMFDLFHPDGSERGWDPYTDDFFTWYNASTEANEKFLDPMYIAQLKANLSGALLEQEYYGRFVGTTSGAVYPEWDRDKYLVPLEYRGDLPLYSFWDFGIGDLGVCVFAQIDNREVDLRDSSGKLLGKEFISYLHLLDAIAAKDWRATDWADAWHGWLQANTAGRRPDANWGDPAGRQRAQGSGTSVIDDLAAAGVPVGAAPKKAPDFGVRILKNMMAGGRVLANKDAEGAVKLSAAISTHRWHIDANGNRVGTSPVHDWTSHYADPLRYGAAALLGFFPRRTDAPEKPPPPPGTMGFAIDQLTKKTTGYLGPHNTRRRWTISEPIG
jgi:phage terminase large subunit